VRLTANTGAAILPIHECAPVSGIGRGRNSHREGVSFMPTGVIVRDNESFEQALRRFKRKCEKSGILSEVKRGRFYEKPSDRRKREMIQARKKMLRKLAKQRRAGLL
jgi:small subunit ribosomal protein S21